MDSKMSVAEALEFFGLPANQLPTLEQLTEAGAGAVQENLDKKLIGEAYKTLRRVHPSSRDLARQEDLSLVLDIPPSYFGNRRVAEAFVQKNRGVVTETEAERLFVQLYGPYKMHLSQNEAWRALGLKPGASAEQIRVRVERLEKSLEVLIARETDAFQKATYKEALGRVKLATRIANSPNDYPLSWSAPQAELPLIGKADYIPAKLRPLVKEVLDGGESAAALEQTLGKLRRSGYRDGKRIDALKIAIASRRASEIAHFYTASDEQAELFSWLQEIYLSQLNEVLSSEMSVIEALEYLALTGKKVPSLDEIGLAAKLATNDANMERELVEQAARVLRRVHPTNRNLAKAEDLASILNIPPVYLNPRVAKAFAKIKRTDAVEAAAEHLFVRLYGPDKMRPAHSDAWEVLGPARGDG